MKQSIFFAVVAALIVCSCGTAKQSTSTVIVPSGNTSSSSGIKKSGDGSEGSLCYELQEQKPAVRSVGVGTNRNEAFAKQTAVAQAQAEFATKISAAIEAACEEVGVNLQKYVGDDETGNTLIEESSEGGNYISSVAKQTVKNTSVIKTERFLQPNKQYRVYVCLEYGEGVSDLIDGVEDQIKDKISPEDRAKLEARHESFRKRMESKLSSL